MGGQPFGESDGQAVPQSPVEGQAKTWHGVDETSSVSRTYARTEASVQMPVWRHGMYW